MQFYEISLKYIMEKNGLEVVWESENEKIVVEKYKL
jgi:hypothetical protein